MGSAGDVMQERSESAGATPFHHFLNRAIYTSLYVCAATIMFSISIAQAAALFALLVFIVKSIAVKGYRFKHSHIQIPFAVFVLARLIAIPLSQYPARSMEAFQTEIFFYGLFFVVLHEFDVFNWKHIRALVWVFFITAVASAVYGSVTQLVGIHPRAESTTAGYYTLGMYLCTVLPLVFPMAGRGIIIKPKWLWFAGSVVILLGLLLTYNRLHWLAAGLALLFAGWIYDKKMLAVFAVLAAVLVFILPNVGTRFDMMVHLGAHMSSRDIIFKGAAMIWDQHPVFGFGLRTFPDIFPLFAIVQDKGIGSWHNDFLQVYMECGIVGLAAFLWLHVSVVWYGIRAVKRMASDDPYRVILVSLLITMVPFIVAGFMVDSLMHLLYFFIAGMIAAIESTVLRKPKTVEGARA